MIRRRFFGLEVHAVPVGTMILEGEIALGHVAVDQIFTTPTAIWLTPELFAEISACYPEITEEVNEQ